MGDALDVVASLSCVIYRMIKDPRAIRDFARTLLRSPASFPTISPDRQRQASRRARDGAGK
jgi:hypothetical protein